MLRIVSGARRTFGGIFFGGLIKQQGDSSQKKIIKNHCFARERRMLQEKNPEGRSFGPNRRSTTPFNLYPGWKENDQLTDEVGGLRPSSATRKDEGTRKESRVWGF